MTPFEIQEGTELSLLRLPGFAPGHLHAFVIRGARGAVLFRPGPVPREEICRAAHIEGATLDLAKQVHGATVLEASALEASELEALAVETSALEASALDPAGEAAAGGAASKRMARVVPEADALISRSPSRAVGVATADCLPILIAAGNGACAAVHAGWRGLLAGVVEAALLRLRDGRQAPHGISEARSARLSRGRGDGPFHVPSSPGGSTATAGFLPLDRQLRGTGLRGAGLDRISTASFDPEEVSADSPLPDAEQPASSPALEAAIGPAIGFCCFEVGPEVAEQFLTRFPAAGGYLRPASVPGKSFVDLEAATVQVLEEGGIDRRAIKRIGLCTRCGSARLESYRRDGPAAGRMIALIVPRPR